MEHSGIRSVGTILGFSMSTPSATLAVSRAKKERCAAIARNRRKSMMPSDSVVWAKWVSLGNN